MEKKILYLMHVDWGWVKQRPQFIAEGLSKFYDVHVFWRIYSIKKPNTSNKNNNLKFHPFGALPHLDYKKGFYSLNNFFVKLYFKYILKKYNPDYIWITYPSMYDFIPHNGNYKIIYDCMDNATAFELEDYYKSKVSDLEKRLIKDATLIFVSANELAKTLNKIHECEDKVFLIRNAFADQILKTDEYSKSNGIFKIGYIGSVSSWFDFESLEYTLKEIENIEYHIIGPVFNVENMRLSSKRMKFYGAIQHADLYKYAAEFDCMIMPFKLNELILSVDPVKLYEYINFNKPIIAVFYDEIERFSPFTFFYSTKEELVKIIKTLVKNGFQKKYSDIQRVEFLKDNSWDNRVPEIVHYIEKVE